MALIPARRYLRDDNTYVFISADDVWEALFPGTPPPAALPFFRIPLTGAKTYTFGSGQDFASIQAGLNYLVSSVDTRGNAVTFQEVGGATYTSGLILQSGWTGGGSVTIKGTGKTGTHFNISTANAFGFHISRATLPGLLTIQDMKITCSGSAIDCIRHQGVGHVDFGNIDFHPVQFAVSAVTDGAELSANPGLGSNSVSSTTMFGIAYAQALGSTDIRGATLNFTGGVPTFQAGCLYADGGTVTAVGTNYPGAAGAVGYGAWAQFRGDIIVKGTTPPGSLGIHTETNGTYS